MIYIKTEAGKTALHDRSLGLSPRQRSAFIMFDGKRDVEGVLKLTAALGVTVDDITRLVELSLLAPQDVAPVGLSLTEPAKQPVPAPAALASTVSALVAPTSARDDQILDDQAHYARAYPVAVRLTSNLGLRGFRLNLAVESATDLEKLKDLAPKIKEAIGVEKFRELEDALYR